jgi:N6-adenosine-specific RNA methylase IME4
MTSAPKADNLPLPPLPEEKFGLIAIDCPWHFATRAPLANPDADRSPQKHYPTMDLEHLEQLPIRQLALPDAHVMAWLTGPLLAQGVHNRLFRKWGVRPSSMGFVWIKLWPNFNMAQLARTPLLENDLAMGTGYTTRQNAEFVVFGRIGSPTNRRGLRQVIISNRREHSRKPEEFYRRAELYCHGPRLDMFGGAPRPGWTHLGWGHRAGEAEPYEGPAA